VEIYPNKLDSGIRILANQVKETPDARFEYCSFLFYNLHGKRVLSFPIPHLMKNWVLVQLLKNP